MSERPEPINTPEYREALAARRGRAEGSHILPEPDGQRHRVELHGDYTQPPDPTALLLARKLLEAQARAERAEAAMTIPRTHFNWELNVGHVLTMLTILIGISGSALFGYTAYKDQQQATDRRFEEVIGVIHQIQDAATQSRKDIDLNQASALRRLDADNPRIQSLEQSQKVQDERLEGLSQSVRSLRDSVSDLVKAVGQTHEDLAVMRAQVRPGGPHSEIPIPERFGKVEIGPELAASSQ